MPSTVHHSSEAGGSTFHTAEPGKAQPPLFMLFRYRWCNEHHMSCGQKTTPASLAFAMLLSPRFRLGPEVLPFAPQYLGSWLGQLKWLQLLLSL